MPDNQSDQNIQPINHLENSNGDPNTRIDPGLIQIAELIKEGLIQNKEKDIEQQKIDLEALKIEIKDRQLLTGLIVGSILAIIIVISILTLNGQFEGTTFAFLLGTSVGSLFTILSKLFVLPKEE